MNVKALDGKIDFRKTLSPKWFNVLTDTQAYNEVSRHRSIGAIEHVILYRDGIDKKKERKRKTLQNYEQHTRHIDMQWNLRIKEMGFFSFVAARYVHHMLLLMLHVWMFKGSLQEYSERAQFVSCADRIGSCMCKNVKIIYYYRSFSFFFAHFHSFLCTFLLIAKLFISDIESLSSYRNGVSISRKKGKNSAKLLAWWDEKGNK